MAKLHVGDKLPNFEFKNAYDVTKTVEKDVLGKKTVFWVIRYIGCTICRYDVHVLAQLHEQFKAKGVQVFVVMQSDPAIVREELKEAIEKAIRAKGDLAGSMASQGTTPRRLTDLIGSLCDLTSGSGDKGTPIVYIQGYFDNYTTD